MRRLSALIVTIAAVSACGSGPATVADQPANTNKHPSTADNQPPTADFGRFGAYHLGMTADEVLAAADGELVEDPTSRRIQDSPPPCKSFIDADTTAAPADRLAVLLLRDAGYRVVGIRVPIHARTTTGIGYGSTPAEVHGAYQGKEIHESLSQGIGHEILVKGDAHDSYLGFSQSEDGNSITAIRVGTHDFAANYELCSGM